MAAINKEELIKEVTLFLKDIDTENPKLESLEWYLRNNLGDYLLDIKKADTSIQIKKATYILSRFCIESMDWDTYLFQRCTKITELGLKLAKVVELGE